MKKTNFNIDWFIYSLPAALTGVICADIWKVQRTKYFVLDLQDCQSHTTLLLKKWTMLSKLSN